MFGFIFVFDGTASIYIFYLIIKNLVVYKVYGLTFWLLVLLGLSVVIFVIQPALDL